MSKQLASVRTFRALSVAELVAMGPCPDPTNEVQRLESILRPASPQEALVCLRGMYRQFAVSMPTNPEDRREVHRGYLLAMEGYPLWILEDVARAFVRGEIERPDFDFMPKPARLGHELSRRVNIWRVKFGAARRQVREAAEFAEDASGPLSSEVRAFGKRRVAELRASAAKKRRVGLVQNEWEDPNPITIEMLNAAGVPDAEPRRDPF